MATARDPNPGTDWRGNPWRDEWERKPRRRHFTVTEIARLTGSATRTVKRWIQSGKLQPSHRTGKNGKYIRFDAASLARACAQGRIRGLTTGWLELGKRATVRSVPPPISGQRPRSR